jgi:hypothetical protein
MGSPLSRREYLAKSLLFGVGAALGLIHTACGSDRRKAFTCTDTTGLTPEELKTREALAYVDRTTDPNKTCSNCQLFEPAAEKQTCGGCTLVRGPFHPQGYCNSWVSMAGAISFPQKLSTASG